MGSIMPRTQTRPSQFPRWHSPILFVRAAEEVPILRIRLFDSNEISRSSPCGRHQNWFNEVPPRVVVRKDQTPLPVQIAPDPFHFMNRRNFLRTSSLATLALGTSAATGSAAAATDLQPIKLALKCGMAAFNSDLAGTFATLKELGYDGVELDSPGGQNKSEALAASKTTGLPIHGVVNSIHWNVRLSDPSEEVRNKSLEGLLTAIRESAAVGGSSVLLVPAVVDNHTTHDQAWERSITQIRKALPLAAELGIHILIENVWNQFLYQPDGGNAQDAKLLCDYLDEIHSPWIGSYFDIGNHQRYGQPAEWIRQLGKRIVKLDVKDWGVAGGFGKIGEGDVDWPSVRQALAEIQYTGWATAEVGGGNRERCAEILANMRKHLLGRK
jgi:L-ribulose-5-phosphate 3-epimerase